MQINRKPNHLLPMTHFIPQNNFINIGQLRFGLSCWQTDKLMHKQKKWNY